MRACLGKFPYVLLTYSILMVLSTTSNATIGYPLQNNLDVDKLKSIATMLLGVSESSFSSDAVEIKESRVKSDSILNNHLKADMIDIVKVKIDSVRHDFKGEEYFRDYELTFEKGTGRLLRIYSLSEEYGYPKYKQSPGIATSKRYIIEFCKYFMEDLPDSPPITPFSEAAIKSYRYPWQAREIEAYFVRTTTKYSKEPFDAWIIIMRGVDPPFESGSMTILRKDKAVRTSPTPVEERNTMIQFISDQQNKLMQMITPAPIDLW